jgi:hypothetical protein
MILRQLLDQFHGLLEVLGLKALGRPAIERGQEPAGTYMTSL